MSRKSAIAFAAVLCIAANSQTLVTQTFNYTGGVQTFTMPYCVSTITVQMMGAGGGYGQSNSSTPGLGGSVMGVITSTPGTVLYLNVGGQGSLTAGGFNGGGSGGISLTSSGAGGGGASDIRIGSNTVTARIMVAAGGGGNGGNGYGGPYNAIGANGGGGSSFSSASGYGGGGASGCASGSSGGDNGGSATGYGSGGGGGGYTSGGSGGGQPSASTGGYGCNGALGLGGDGGGNNYICGGAASGQNGGGGGGGGYYGGGGGMTGTGGCNGGGGGGSSWTNSSLFSSIGYTAGTNGGHGQISLTYTSGGANVIATSNTTSICAGQTVSMSASNVSSYTWVPVGSFAGSNGTAITVTPAATTVYTVSGTAGSCVSSVMITVSVTAGAPTLTTVANTNTFCLGMPVTFTATGAYSYTWAPNIVSNVATYTPAATTVYTVSGSNPCGISTKTHTVTLTPLPVLVAANPATVCALKPAVLTASGATNYTWTPGPITGSMITQSPASNTIYTVTAFNGTCTGSNTLALYTNPNPTLTIATTATQVCTGESATITAGGAISYTWNQPNITGTFAAVSPSTSTLYQVTGSNSLGCTAGASTVVLVVQPPAVTGNLSSTVVCPGTPVTLSASGAANYTWSSGGNTSSTVVSPTITTIYNLIATSSNNTCVALQSYTVGVETPSLAVSPSTAICIGSAITLTAGAGANYNWQPGGSGFQSLSNISPTATIIYTVTADVTGSAVTCPASNTVQITVNPNPTISISTTHTLVCKRDPITLNASGGASYSWFNQQTGASTTFTTTSIGPQSYTVEGTDANGCTSVAAISMSISLCNGIANNEPSARLMVYPNPNNGDFNIRTDKPLTLQVVNALGQVVRTVNMTGNDVTVTGLADGVYMIVSDSDKTISQSVIVQH